MEVFHLECPRDILILSAPFLSLIPFILVVVDKLKNTFTSNFSKEKYTRAVFIGNLPNSFIIVQQME